LLDELFINPYVTASRAAERLGVSNPTAARSIDVLVKAGMLKETKGLGPLMAGTTNSKNRGVDRLGG